MFRIYLLTLYLSWSFYFFTSLLNRLLRLLVEKRINFKLATLTYRALAWVASGSPAYLSSSLMPYDTLQWFPAKTNLGSRAFYSAAASSVCNLLLYPVRAFSTLSNKLSKLTISSLPSSRPFTSHLHPRLGFHFRHWHGTHFICICICIYSKQVLKIAFKFHV